MLKITTQKSSRTTTLRVEGRLLGPWIAELERAWQTATTESAVQSVVIDLSDVTLISEEGKTLLETLYARGTNLKASGCATRRIVDEIIQNVGRHTSKQPLYDRN